MFDERPRLLLDGLENSEGDPEGMSSSSESVETLDTEVDAVAAVDEGDDRADEFDSGSELCEEGIASPGTVSGVLNAEFMNKGSDGGTALLIVEG